MKKLLFVIEQFYKGGTETSLINLLKYLDKTKYEIDLLVLNHYKVKNAVSLFDKVPKEINLFNAIKEETKRSFPTKVKARLMLSTQDRHEALSSAVLFVRDKIYDCAFHVGEWWAPGFVAQYVRAKRKCIWIHSDISEAKYFNAEEFFKYHDVFSNYIFVSQNSLNSSLKKFTFLKDKSLCIYNISDTEEIKKNASEPVNEDYFSRGLPVVVTVANVRNEKNHRRALEAMGILKSRGYDFLWINIGATSDKNLCQLIESRSLELGLEDRFILAGPRNNPFPYVKNADVIAVLSDFESWSLTITEAKILSKPIIATRTSGALEQIEDHKTGLLTDFYAEDIADKLEELLKSDLLRKSFSQNLEFFDNRNEILETFESFVNDTEQIKLKKELLYIIDDLNYLGGAHKATKLQISELLKKGIDITIFSGSIPNVKTRVELAGARYIFLRDIPADKIMHRRLADCLLDKNLPWEDKKLKLDMTKDAVIKKDMGFYEKRVMPGLTDLFSGYKTVCVMSEGSIYRKYAAEAECKHKVQWIHTDYVAWKNESEWAKMLTRNDAEMFSKFDRIVVLGADIKKKFLNLYPHLEGKVTVCQNLMPVDEILEKSIVKRKQFEPLNFVTVSRIDQYKGFERLFIILQELYDEGYRFHWTIIGDGEDSARIKSMFQNSLMKDDVVFTGQMQNPFPYVREADVFALFSDREGLPNTIYESLILGTPVAATNVGSIKNQIKDEETGWLVENNEKAIYKVLETIMSHPEAATQMKKNLKDYRYDNTEIFKHMEKILFLN